MSRGIFLPGDKLLCTGNTGCLFCQRSRYKRKRLLLPEYGMAFCRDESVVSVMIITALGSIGDKPRPVPARAVVCIY